MSPRTHGGATKEKVKFVGKDDEHLMFNNNFVDDNGKKPVDFKGFYIKNDSQLAQQLINFSGHTLQPEKKFILAFTKFAKHDNHEKNNVKADI